ncbi:hypothetical protein MRX96_053126 [Rhipicephalus microplus]
MRVKHLLKLSRNLPRVVPWSGTTPRNQVREGKRPRDTTSTESSDMSNQEPPPKAALLRRQRLAVKHNITEGEKRTGKPGLLTTHYVSPSIKKVHRTTK